MPSAKRLQGSPAKFCLFLQQRLLYVFANIKEPTIAHMFVSAFRCPSFAGTSRTGQPAPRESCREEAALFHSKTPQVRLTSASSYSCFPPSGFRAGPLLPRIAHALRVCSLSLSVNTLTLQLQKAIRWAGGLVHDTGRLV